MRTSARVVVVGACLTGLSLASTTAGATPGGPGVSGRVLAQRTVGNTD